jgi:transposase-like protein
MQNDSELIGLVVGHKRDGRCQYDPEVKRELVRQCMQPGVSVAGMAMQHGINANLLRLWIMKTQGRSDISPKSGGPVNRLEISPAFVPVQIQAPVAPTTQTETAHKPHTQSRLPVTPSMRMQVRLPNGVEVDLGGAHLDEITGVMQMLSALPCSN